MIIIIDGPEKAGKTTLIDSLVKKFISKSIPAERVHWGVINPDDRVYSPMVQQHVQDLEKVWVWDRGWPSEYVYGNLLNRKSHRMTEDPWLGEWLHGRAVQTMGLRVILTGPSAPTLYEKRTSDDHDVNIMKEVELYKEYGVRFGWNVIENYNHTQEALEKLTEDLYQNFMGRIWYQPWSSDPIVPPNWCGPMGADTVVVGESLSKQTLPGGWLPFTSGFTTQFAREFGDYAFKMAWTNASDCDPVWLRKRKQIILCGNVASQWYDQMVDPRLAVVQTVFRFPHPSHVYRFQTEESQYKINTMRNIISSIIYAH